MQGHSDILDEAICALYDGDLETYYQCIGELQELHVGAVEIFNRWLITKIKECLEALEFTLSRARNALQKSELTRKASVLRFHIENLDLESGRPTTSRVATVV